MKGIYIRGDYTVCPQPLSLDTYTGCEFNCRFCFIKTMEQTLLKNKIKNGLLPIDTVELENKVRRIEKGDKNVFNMVNRGHPVIVGRKCEPYGKLEKEHQATYKSLKILKDNNITVTAETKGWIDAKNYDYLDGVNYSFTPINDEMSKHFEPGLPNYTERLETIKNLVKSGVKVFVKGEPIIPSLYPKTDLEQWIRDVADTNAISVNFSAYRVHNLPLDYKNFSKSGYDFKECMKSLNDWDSYATLLHQYCDDYGIRGVSPDWVISYPSHLCESCCGYDGHFPAHKLSMQHASNLMSKSDKVTIDDIIKDNDGLLLNEYIDGFKKIWNSSNGYYTLADINGIIRQCKDQNGNWIYEKAKNKNRRFGDVF